MRRILLTSVAVAAVTAVATFALAGEPYMTPAEKAAPTVEAYTAVEDGVLWNYVKVRTFGGGLVVLRCRFPRNAPKGKEEDCGSRTLIVPEDSGKTASRR